MLARIVKSAQVGSVALRQYPRSALYAQVKHFSDKADDGTESSRTSEQKSSDKLGTFAKAFNELEQINEKKDQTPVDTVPFKKLLRQSKLIDVSSIIQNGNRNRNRNRKSKCFYPKVNSYCIDLFGFRDDNFFIFFTDWFEFIALFLSAGWSNE